MTNTLIVTTPSECEIVITRVFNAPRNLVFDCWTKPELLRRWMLGPEGWIFAVCEIDLKVGGKYRFVWRSSEGNEMGMGGVYREIMPPERIADTQLFDEDWTGGETAGTLVFTEHGGKTTTTNTIRYSSTVARDAALATGMAQGLGMGYDRLDTYLASIA